jgi:hypothetical protein
MREELNQKPVALSFTGDTHRILPSFLVLPPIEVCVSCDNLVRISF